MDSCTIKTFISGTIGSPVFPPSPQTSPLHAILSRWGDRERIQTWMIKVILEEQKFYPTLFHLFPHSIIWTKWKIHLNFVVLTLCIWLWFFFKTLNNTQIWVFCLSRKIISGDLTIQLSRWKWSPQFLSFPKMIRLLLFLINWTRWHNRYV